MLYFLGGAARAGKSTLARAFARQIGLPYLSLDYLMMGLVTGAPELRVEPEEDELVTAERMWPVVRALASAMAEDALDYLLEGVQLHPQRVAEFAAARPGYVRACFLGYAETTPRAKLAELRTAGGGLEDWLRHYGDARALAEMERLIALSARLRDECNLVGLPYVEMVGDREAAAMRVFSLLGAP